MRNSEFETLPGHHRRIALFNSRFSVLDLRSSTVVFIVTALVGIGVAGAEDERPEKSGDAPDREAQLAAMRKIAGGVKMTVGDEEPLEVEVIAEPLFRFNDSARDFSDGSIWGFGSK